LVAQIIALELWKAEKRGDDTTDGVMLNDHSVLPLCHSLVAHSLCDKSNIN